MLDKAALRAELAKDEHKSRSAAEIAATLNERTVEIARPIAAADILKLWSRWMMLATCEEVLHDLRASGSPEAMPARVLLNATINNLRGNVFGDLDPADPTQTEDIEKYLAGLVAAGVLTEEQKVQTLALGRVEVPFPVSIGTNNLNADEIEEALKDG